MAEIDRRLRSIGEVLDKSIPETHDIKARTIIGELEQGRLQIEMKQISHILEGSISNSCKTTT